MKPGRPKDPSALERRARKKAEEKSLGLHRKDFDKKQIDRMFARRADGASNNTIAKEFGTSTNKVRELIGPRPDAIGRNQWSS